MLLYAILMERQTHRQAGRQAERQTGFVSFVTDDHRQQHEPAEDLAVCLVGFWLAQSFLNVSDENATTELCSDI